MLSDLRLYQLISPALPVGAFTYSQGLEWAIENGWVSDAESLSDWLTSVLQNSVTTLELPVLLRLYQAVEEQNHPSFIHWCQWLIACRETSELRAEERQRGQALTRLLPSLKIDIPDELQDALCESQLAGIAVAAQQWHIPISSLAGGYLWSWLENAVMAGVKLVPLGQTDGQKLLLTLSEKIPPLVELAEQCPDNKIGSSAPALAIASSRHETQYTRLFRS